MIYREEQKEYEVGRRQTDRIQGKEGRIQTGYEGRKDTERIGGEEGERRI